MTDTITHSGTDVSREQRRRRIALVASKGTLDQAYPPLILATTAASLGWEAGVYFTFYGLDIIHNDRLEKLKVASLANPAGPIQLPNLLGALPGATAAATKMMKKWMSDARMPTVPEFIEMAQGLDVRLPARRPWASWASKRRPDQGVRDRRGRRLRRRRRRSIVRLKSSAGH